MNALREQIRGMLRVETREGAREGRFRAEMVVDPKLMVLPDHFRDHPVLPGICMIQAVLLAGSVRLGVGELRLRELRKAKWMLPVGPGERIVMEGEMQAEEPGLFVIKAKLMVGDKRCAEFLMMAGAVGEGV